MRVHIYKHAETKIALSNERQREILSRLLKKRVYEYIYIYEDVITFYNS